MATFTTSESRDRLDFNKPVTHSTSILGAVTEINSLMIEPEKINNVSNAAILARSGVPDSHRRVADNYMIIKKIFGFPVVQSKISFEERKLLAKYDFNLLEFSTIKQINEELTFLKKWSISRNHELQDDADRLIQIRAKELKYLIATKFVNITNEVYSGYKLLEKYFEDISKYAEK